MELIQESTLRDGRVVRLRPTQPDDGAALIEIEQQVMEENIANVGNDLDGYAKRITERLKEREPRRLWLVAEHAGQVVGAVELVPYGPNFMEHLRVLGIALHRDWRGSGLGSLLLRTAIAWARGQGVEAIHLRVLDSNPRAKALYARFGFQEIGHTPRLVKRDDGSYSDDTAMMLWLGDTPLPEAEGVD